LRDSIDIPRVDPARDRIERLLWEEYSNVFC